MNKMLAAAAGLALSAIAVGAQGKTLVFCSEGSPEGFNPQLFTAGTTFDASSRQVYDGLVQFERGTTNIMPGLAESWSVSDDGLVYTFNLRKGVKFHSNEGFTPTRDFNADDVIFSFERQWKPDNPYHKVSGGTYEYFNGMSMPDLLKEIERVDDYTVRFHLNRPEAPFIANLGMDFASILSASTPMPCLRPERRKSSTWNPSAPVLSSSRPIRKTRSSATWGLRTTGKASRPSTSWCFPLHQTLRFAMPS